MTKAEEIEIKKMLSAGLGGRQIARETQLPVSSVAEYIKKLKNKEQETLQSKDTESDEINDQETFENKYAGWIFIVFIFLVLFSLWFLLRKYIGD